MLPSGVRILLCTEPQDMRRSFDALALVAQQVLGEDPQDGVLLVFVGKRPTRVKVLWWDRNGYCLLYKRFHRAIVQLPSADGAVGKSLKIDGAALAQLLAGVPHENKRTKRLT